MESLSGASARASGLTKPAIIHFSDFNNSDINNEYVYSSKTDDVILCYVFKNASYPGTIKFTINAGKNVTWWKGLSLESSDGSVFKSAEINGRDDTYGSVRMTVRTNDLAGKTLVFSKAKFLGVHTPAYAIEDTETCFADGNEYLFVWVKD